MTTDPLSRFPAFPLSRAFRAFRMLELPARLQEELRNTPGIGYEMTQRIAMVDDSQLQEDLIAAAVAGEITHSIRHRIASHQTEHKTAPKRKRSSNLIQLTEKQGSCLVTVKATRDPGVREVMLAALRRLT